MIRKNESRSPYTSRDYVLDVVKYGASDEPEGMWRWANDGIRLFNFSGSTLVDFVDQCIEALQSRGAVPCKPGYPTYVDEWVGIPGLGDTPDAIRARVIADWLASGGGEVPFWTGVWFGLPHQVVPLSEARLAARRG